MPGRASLLDLGCGVGLIDIAVADEFSRITCVDRDDQALRLLEADLAARNISNIKTWHANAADVRGQWDTVLMVFFGHLEEQLRHALSLCRHNIIAVIHGDAQGTLGPKDYHPPKCGTVSGTRQALHALGARYAVQEHALEYGQPFASREEAIAFVRAYSKNPPDMAVADYLDARLTETGRADFPYYLPNLKRFGIFVIGREQNAHL